MIGSSRTRSMTLHLALILVLTIGVLTARSMGVTVYIPTLAADTALYALALMGLSVLYGWSGQLSLGHAAFMGIGAYTAALVSPHSDGMPVPWLVDLGAVVVVGAIAGVAVGLPALRVSGIQLIVITLGFAEVFQWALNNFNEVSGGTQGLILAHTSIASMDFGYPDQRFLATVVLAAIGGLVLQALSKTTVARSMLAVRDSEQAASSVGIAPATPKLVAFVVSAVFASVAGWLAAYGSLIVIPGTFGLFDNVFMLVAVIIGGRSTLLGAWLGALFLVLVPEVSRDVANGALYPVIAGIVLLAVMLMAPRGLADSVQQGLRKLRGRLTRRRRPASDQATLQDSQGAKA